MDRGPIETAVSSPGFTLFWNDILKCLREMHDKLIVEAETAVKAGEAAKGTGALIRAAQVREIVERIQNAPIKARDKEKESIHGRPDESRRAGYDTI